MAGEGGRGRVMTDLVEFSSITRAEVQKKKLQSLYITHDDDHRNDIDNDKS